MARLMSGWMDADAHEQGLEQELDACLITDFCSPFFIHIVSKKKYQFVCVFVQLYWSKGGVAS